MNRQQSGGGCFEDGVPHMRGDEPGSVPICSFVTSVPHMRGDEPMSASDGDWSGLCSPHAWG